VLDPAKASLWFATKELARDKQLKDYLGKHEKTKVIPRAYSSPMDRLW
jgi:hypothetical protein